MMKLNWGNGIFVFLLLFVAACIAFLLYTRTVDFTLVEDDYYSKELKHEEVLVKMRNNNSLQEPLNIKICQNSINIYYPRIFKAHQLSGFIQVYRPSDKHLDFTVPINVDTALVQTISFSKLKRGNYIIKVDWSDNGKGYYKEQELFIP